MKIPLAKWISTSEGTWTILRLLTAILIVVVALSNGLNSYVPLFFNVIVLLFGISIMIRAAIIFIVRPEFKTMKDGKAADNFYTEDIYKYIRHPFYLGFLLLMLGTVLCCTYWVTVFLFVIYVALTIKTIHEEENRLGYIFATKYFWYQQYTPKLVPKKIVKFIKVLFSLGIIN
jgi:protein-S-isoprenylcysteine O-methyltransferase Ste14